ncbi:serine hydrolase, partial [Candidatus Ichthyocystis sparus]
METDIFSREDVVVQHCANTVYPPKELLCIDRTLDLSVTQGLTGAVLLLMLDGIVVWKKAYGYKNRWNCDKEIDNPEPTTVDTLYDLASLTKIYATMQSCMKLFDSKQLDISRKVSYYVPSFCCGQKDSITVRMLLQHRSGLPGSYQFYDPKVAGNLFSQERTRSLSFLPQVPLVNSPDTKTQYSDIGVCLLGLIIENITGTSEDKFIEYELYQKLGLKRTKYRLKEKLGLSIEDFAATEPCGNTRNGSIYFPNIRTNTIQGEVQDETTFYSFDGISGSAGLFSCVDELAILSQMMLNGGSYNGFRWCSPQTVSKFMKEKSTDGEFALLWHKNKPYEIATGILPKPNAVWHTGWVGTFSMLDYKANAAIIYLSNKKNSQVLIHPNTFWADCAVTSTYGIIADLFYRG